MRRAALTCRPTSRIRSRWFQGSRSEARPFSPAAMVGFFEELAEAESKGTATPELLSHISERNGMGIIGPVPDTYL